MGGRPTNAHEEGIGTRSISATKQHCNIRNNLEGETNMIPYSFSKYQLQENPTHLDHHVLLRLARCGRQGRAELLQEAGQVLDR